MMVFYPLDTARLTLQGRRLWWRGPFCYDCHVLVITKGFYFCFFSVDEKRKSKSAHTVLGEIFKEGGL